MGAKSEGSATRAYKARAAVMLRYVAFDEIVRMIKEMQDFPIHLQRHEKLTYDNANRAVATFKKLLEEESVEKLFFEQGQELAINLIACKDTQAHQIHPCSGSVLRDMLK